MGELLESLFHVRRGKSTSLLAELRVSRKGVFCGTRRGCLLLFTQPPASRFPITSDHERADLEDADSPGLADRR